MGSTGRFRRAAPLLKVGAAALVGILIGAALRGPVIATRATSTPRLEEGDGPAAGESPHVSDDEPVGPGPRSSVGGVGVGFTQTEEGAVAAAVSYAAASQSWLYLDDVQLEEAVGTVVAPVAPQLVDQVSNEVALLRDRLGDADGTVWFVVAPLATKLDSFDSSSAVVRVWVVRVLSADGVAVPQSGWQTLTFELGWYGDWKVADLSEAEGPTPQLEAGLQPWAAGYLDETLVGFVRVGLG
jgi:hypothetical protein